MPHCRPFKLIDSMILTAAVAVWIAWMRPLLNELQRATMASEKGTPWQVYAWIVPTGLNIAVLMLAFAYLVIRLIPPRPPRSDLIRQPGMLLLGLLIGLVILLMALSAFVPMVARDEHDHRPCPRVVLGCGMPPLSIACRAGMDRGPRPFRWSRLGRCHRGDRPPVSPGGLTGRRRLIIRPVRGKTTKKRAEHGPVAPEKLGV